MAASAKAMICPDCGEPMNHHADKLDQGAALDDPGAADPLLGGVLYEAHTCGLCGRSATTRASLWAQSRSPRT